MTATALAPQTRTRRVPRQRKTLQLFAGLVTVTSAAAALGGKIPIGSGDNGINAFDLLVLSSIVILYRHAVNGLPRRFSMSLGVVFLLAAIGILLPVGGHYVLRSAGALLVLQAVAVSVRFSTALVRGYLAGMLLHVGIAIGGYVAARSVSVSEQSFQDLRSYRASFDWFAGPLDAPPLITSGLLRMQGLMGHPNEFAMLVVIAALLAVRAVRSHRTQMILVAIFAGATLMALSRIAIVIMIFALVFGSNLGGRRVRRGLLVLGSATAVLLTLSGSIRDRLFDVGDQENAQVRSAGPLELIDDATLWPNDLIATRHNSIAFMLDVAGVALGFLWIAALAYGLLVIVRRGLIRPEWALIGTLLVFFMTEDRIQAPSFMLASLVSFAIVLQRHAWPVGRSSSRVVERTASPETRSVTAGLNVRSTR